MSHQYDWLLRDAPLEHGDEVVKDGKVVATIGEPGWPAGGSTVGALNVRRKWKTSVKASELSFDPGLQIRSQIEPGSELGLNQAKPIQDDPRQPRESTEANGANATQHGGTHYKSRAIQPWDYVAANGLGFFEGNAIKYLTRWRDKGGIEDLLKAQHYIVKLIEVESVCNSAK